MLPPQQLYELDPVSVGRSFEGSRKSGGGEEAGCESVDSPVGPGEGYPTPGRCGVTDRREVRCHECETVHYGSASMRRTRTKSYSTYLSTTSKSNVINYVLTSFDPHPTRKVSPPATNTSRTITHRRGDL